jgi:hypothetical protein
MTIEDNGAMHNASSSLAYSSSLPFGRFLAKIVFMTVSSCLSVVGSASIVYFCRNKWKHRLYNRLLVRLSCADVCFSLSFILQPWLVPQRFNTTLSIGAYGTTASCTAIGFIFTYMAMVVSLLNCSLSLSYQKTICQGFTEQALVDGGFERRWCILSFTIPLILGVAGVLVEGYNPDAFSKICSFENRIYGDFSSHGPEVGYAWLLVILLSTGIGLRATFQVYKTVRDRAKANQRHVFQGGSGSGGGGSEDIGSCNAYSLGGTNSPNSCVSINLNDEDNTNSTSIQPENANKYKNSDESESNTEQEDPPRNSSQEDGRITVAATSTIPSPTVTTITTTARATPPSLSSLETRRVNMVALQAIFYSIAYLNTIAWPIVVAVASAGFKKQTGQLYVLDLISWGVYPLQGFWNFLVFSRPTYLQWRAFAPDKSIAWTLKQLFNSDMTGPTTTSSSRNGDNSGRRRRGRRTSKRSLTPSAHAIRMTGTISAIVVDATMTGNNGIGSSSTSPSTKNVKKLHFGTMMSRSESTTTDTGGFGGSDSNKNQNGLDISMEDDGHENSIVVGDDTYRHDDEEKRGEQVP